MGKMIVKEFKNQSNIELIESLMNSNNGYITSKMVTDLGIHRMYLNIMCEKGIIERVGKGIYLDSNKFEDSYYILCLENPNIIFSHMTALYFHGLSIKEPYSEYDITIFNKYHNPRLKNHNIFYVTKDIYNLGLTEVETPAGNKVKAYDIERCICDIIRSKKRMDIEHIKYSIRQYLKRKDKDLVKLTNYAEKMKIRKEAMEIISLLS